MEKEILKNDEISLAEIFSKLKEWFNYLLSKWIIVVSAGLIGGVLGFANAYSKKPVYTGELTFALEEAQSGGGLGAYSGLASMVGIDLGGGAGGVFSGGNLIELMKSREIIVKSLLTTVKVDKKDQTLAELYIKANDLRESWKDNKRLQSITFPAGIDRRNLSFLQDSLCGVFYKNITGTSLTVLKKDDNLSIITVNVKSANELFAKHFTETLVETVSKFYVESKTKKSAENVYILQHQTDSVRMALVSALRGGAAAADNNPSPNPSMQILRVPSQVKQVDAQINTIALGELVKNLEIAKMSLRKESQFIQVIDRPILPLFKTRPSRSIAFLVWGILAGIFVSVILLVKQKKNRI